MREIRGGGASQEVCTRSYGCNIREGCGVSSRGRMRAREQPVCSSTQAGNSTHSTRGSSALFAQHVANLFFLPPPLEVRDSIYLVKEKLSKVTCVSSKK